MHRIESISAALAQSLRRGAPSVHPLDDAENTLHLGAYEGSELVGVVSGFPVDPAGRADPAWRQVWGPFGRGGIPLVQALAQLAHVWADSERPGLRTPRDGVWGRSAGGYSADDIELLESVEAIRRRPGMYIGSTGLDGMRLLVRELVDQTVEEHMAGHATVLRVAVDAAGVSVSDDGRGARFEAFVPTGWMRSPAVVCALSSALIAVVDRGERRHQQLFVRGHPVTDAEDCGPSNQRGTAIRFVPDAAIFGDRRLVADDVRADLADLAVLHPGLRITLDGIALPSHGGLAGLARRLADAETTPLHGRVEQDGVTVEFAVAWGPEAIARGWTNDRLTVGSHVAGLVDGLEGTPEDGRVALVSVRVSNPGLSGRTGTHLEDPRVRAMVRDAVLATRG